MKRAFAGILALIMALSWLCVGGFADGVIRISTPEEFLAFCQSCRRDSYSAGRRFLLTDDIALEGADISVPIFSGTFDGDHHTISGLSLTGEGSRQGLFRQTTRDAVIRDLRVEGTVTPGGTGCYVGGVVGENHGAIESCVFTGTVAGVERVGGVAGLNDEGGRLLRCAFSGSVRGETMAGGIAGENRGVILACRNNGKINTEAIEAVTRQTFDISSVFSAVSDGENVEGLLAVSDVGGVAGYSSGTLEGCVNTGAVGYQSIGYNVGGVAGRSGGYVSGCVNSGDVCGRRDVGGVVGQLEPYAVWDFSESKLEELNTRMDALGAAVREMTQSAAAQTAQISGALSQMMRCANSAAAAIGDIVSQAADVTGDIASAARERLDELVGGGAAGESAADTAGLSLDVTATVDVSAAASPPADEAQDEAANEAQDEAESASPAGEQPREPDAEQSGGGSLVDIHDNSLIGDITISPDVDISVGADVDIDAELRLPALGYSTELLEELARALENAQEHRPDTTALVNALSGVYSSAVWLGSAVGSVSAAVTEGAQDVSVRVAEMLDAFVSTVEDVAEVELDRDRDVSRALAYELDVGAVSGCTSTGAARADTNAGGVVGTVGFEVSFDLENELKLTDYLFHEAEHQIFAVIRGCDGHGTVTGGKSVAGGVVGSLSCGVVTDCVASGSISSDGDYAGGVAGNASGAVVKSDARVTVSGTKYVGGVAGLAADVIDCRACAYVTAEEYAGCIAGWADGELSGNTYVDTGASGVDGVEYADRARSVSYRAMLAAEDIPAAFRGCTVTFLAGDRVVETLTVGFGGAVDALPSVPDRDGAYWQWDDFDREHVYSDLTVTGGYIRKRATLSDGRTPETFLVEGAFYPDQTLTAEPFDASSYDASAEGWTLTVSGYGDTPLTVRMRHEEPGALYVVGSGGAAQAEFEQDGSYIVFSLPNGGSFFVTPSKALQTGGALGVVGAVVVGAGAGVGVYAPAKRRGKRTRRSGGGKHIQKRSH